MASKMSAVADAIEQALVADFRQKAAARLPFRAADPLD